MKQVRVGWVSQFLTNSVHLGDKFWDFVELKDGGMQLSFSSFYEDLKFL